MVLCDSYNVGRKEIEAVKLPIIYFRDSDIWRPADNIKTVNCQPGAKSHKNWLSGPLFTPIDTMGKKQTPVDFNSVDDPINCLIGFGAVDSSNMTAVALRALLSDENLKKVIRPICLLGPHFKYHDIVENLLGAFINPRIEKLPLSA